MMQKNVSSKTAGLLVEAGVFIKTEAHWYVTNVVTTGFIVLTEREAKQFPAPTKRICPAPDIPELLGGLPYELLYKNNYYYLTIRRDENNFIAEYQAIVGDCLIIPGSSVSNGELAEVLAQLLIWVSKEYTQGR